MMITIKVKKLSSIVQQTRGLIGRENMAPIVLCTRFGIHTFGLKKPIDILILDSRGQVRKIKQRLKPQSFFIWNPTFNTVVELPEGTIQKEKITVGTNVYLELIGSI